MVQIVEYVPVILAMMRTKVLTTNRLVVRTSVLTSLNDDAEYTRA
jgi:hypothetical protein